MSELLWEVALETRILGLGMGRGDRGLEVGRAKEDARFGTGV